ncbi:MAG: tRNA 2-thiocytidine(32) synthetase TtcA [Firmicutes bacterium]|nr:tRNA 2-thiocytidine(32) synthetase TtcA [Bacillota bacterium]
MGKHSYLKWFKSRVKRAITDYNMITNGDGVVVGLSGGKDSAVLLDILAKVRQEVPVNYDLHAVLIHMGWQMDIDVLEQFCRERGVPFTCKYTDIGEVVFEYRQDKSPCALCANLRRGALNNTVRDIGFNKLALGHHIDDVIETFFMSLFYTGQFKTFSPLTYMDRSGVTLVRPLIYHSGKTVENFRKRYDLPVVKNPCPVAEDTKRVEMAEIIDYLGGRYPDIRRRFLTALQSLDTQNLWPLPLNKRRLPQDNPPQ